MKHAHDGVHAAEHLSQHLIFVGEDEAWGTRLGQGMEALVGRDFLCRDTVNGAAVSLDYQTTQCDTIHPSTTSQEGSTALCNQDLKITHLQRSAASLRLAPERDKQQSAPHTSSALPTCPASSAGEAGRHTDGHSTHSFL